MADGPLRRRWQIWLAIACATSFALSGCAAAENDPSEPSESVAARVSEEPDVVLLFVTDQKDGDSWVASDGNEYRLGLVDTPEANEQCSKEAAAFTREFLASGFTTDTYSTDTHGRDVAEVFNEAGESLNVALAESGLGGDRYLEEFRHENTDLADRLDTALASAPVPSCRKAVAPVPLVNKPAKKAPKSNCMEGYSPCLPIVADLNCPDIGHPVTVTGSDPYRLDRDGDGTGCD